MNWKKALLITVVGLFALTFFVVAAAGLLASAAVGAAAVAISESGAVQAFEEVANGAERLQIDINDNSVTFTNPDSGESRTVTTGNYLGRGRIDLSLPEITVTDSVGENRVIVPGLRAVDELVVPELTITDPDSGQSRVIRPNVERFEDGFRFEDSHRVPRVVWDHNVDWTIYGPQHALNLVGGFFRGLFNLAAVILIVGGAYLLIRNRRRAQAAVDRVDMDNGDIDKTAKGA